MQVIIFFREFPFHQFCIIGSVFTGPDLISSHRSVGTVGRVCISRTFIYRHARNFFFTSEIDIQCHRQTADLPVIHICIQITVKQQLYHIVCECGPILIVKRCCPSFRRHWLSIFINRVVYDRIFRFAAAFRYRIDHEIF